MLPRYLGGDLAYVSDDAFLATRYSCHSGYRSDHAYGAHSCLGGSDRGDRDCGRGASSTAPGITELAHIRVRDRRSRRPVDPIYDHKLAMMTNPRWSGHHWIDYGARYD